MSSSLSSTGIGSGLDIQGIVAKLVSAEGTPKTALLDSAEAKVQGKISALGTLRSALATFQDSVSALKNVDKFRGRAATVSSEDFFAAKAATTSTPGSYAIEVEQLALASKLQSKTFAATSAVVGTGTLRISAGGANFDVTIDSTNNTLADVAAAINKSPAGAKVVATVVTGVNGTARLTITGLATGQANALVITQSGGDGGLADLAYPATGIVGLTALQTAQDAKILIDGFEASSATNTISGAIQGVDISVTAANADGETSTLTVGYDRAAARKTVDDLVKSYNAVIDSIKSVSGYDVKTQKGGPLFGDAGVVNLGYQLRRELTNTVAGLDGQVDTLGAIGVSADINGKLSVDSAKLDVAFDANFDAIGNLFAEPGNGIAVKLDKLLEPYLQTGGVFDSRGDTLQSSIDDIGKQREALTARLTALQARYLKQFNALDSLLSQLKSTSDFLTQQLSQLPGTVQKN